MEDVQNRRWEDLVPKMVNSHVLTTRREIYSDSKLYFSLWFHWFFSHILQNAYLKFVCVTLSGKSSLIKSVCPISKIMHSTFWCRYSPIFLVQLHYNSISPLPLNCNSKIQKALKVGVFFFFLCLTQTQLVAKSNLKWSKVS